MAISDADLWHQVHAEREDGVAAMFLVRDINPRPDQPQIFVIEMPYPVTDLSKLPDAASYRRLDRFQEQWVEPACEALGWTFVASKCEDGSSFLYLYGDGDPNALLEKLAPFDVGLGFFSDVDADWSEYAALRELVDQAEASDDHVHTENCQHDHHETNADEISDGIPVGIPVIDLSGEPAPPTRKPSSRAQTVNLGKPIREPVRAKPVRAKPVRARPVRARPVRAKPVRAKPAPEPAAPRAKTAAKANPKRAAAKPASAKTKKATASKRPVAKAAATRSSGSKTSSARSAVQKAAKRGSTKRR